jgi:hypothetical protein
MTSAKAVLGAIVKRGLSAFSFASKTKACWADGKSGLD